MRSFVVPLLVVFATVALGAAPARAAMFNPTTFTLSNGLRVVVVENRRAPVIVHMVWYSVGSADDPLGKSGIAHFLEHLMFKGTQKVPPGEFSKIVARNGGRDNAFTSHDYTAYFQNVASDRLELVMEMEADRMGGLRLTDAEVLPERQVVLEERRSRTDNNPGAQLQEMMGAVLFLNHPYRIPVIGWETEIAALNTADALDFYRRHYAPNNAVLVVAGDVTPDRVRALAERSYGKIPRRDIAPRVRLREPAQLAARRVVLTSPRVPQPSLSRRYLAPSYSEADGRAPYAAQVLAEILGGGATSRLHRRLVVEQAIATTASTYYEPDNLDLGEFGFSATPRQGTSIAALEQALDAEVAAVLAGGVTDEEVARTKRSMLASAIYARDSLRAAPNLFGRALTTGRTVADVEAWPERIEAVTVDEINRVARDVFRLNRSVTGLLLPEEAP